jgi:hypothetical protein
MTILALIFFRVSYLKTHVLILIKLIITFIHPNIHKKIITNLFSQLFQLSVGKSSSFITGFSLYLLSFSFYFYTSFFWRNYTFFTSSSSSLLYTALLINIPGGLSNEYFSPLKFLLFCSFNLRILEIPVFRSDFKSAGLNYHCLLKLRAISSSSLKGLSSTRDKWISFSSRFSKTWTFL